MFTAMFIDPGLLLLRLRGRSLGLRSTSRRRRPGLTVYALTRDPLHGHGPQISCLTDQGGGYRTCPVEPDKDRTQPQGDDHRCSIAQPSPRYSHQRPPLPPDRPARRDLTRAPLSRRECLSQAPLSGRSPALRSSDGPPPERRTGSRCAHARPGLTVRRPAPGLARGASPIQGSPTRRGMLGARLPWSPHG